MSNLEEQDVPSKELTAQLEHDAHRAVEAEQKMSLWQSLKTYPHAAGWSILLSTAIVMEGYDTVLISNLYAYEPFQRTYGVKGADGKYQLTAAWQSGLNNGALVGEILGLMLNGIIAERFGYRKCLIGALMLCIAFTFIIFFSTSLPVLLVGEILIGIPWGVFQTITTTYAAEVCPVVLRPYLTTYVNLCWVFGQLIASGVLKAMQSRTDEWGYKIPFALQWMWPVPLMIGIALAPESPWWLVRKGRNEDARKALQRLTVPERDPDFNVDETIAMIRSTNAMEKEWSEGLSYWDCFKGVDLRRLEIVCMTWSIQTLCGSTFMGYSTYFFEQAGLAPSNSFTMSIVMYVLGAIGTVTSWILMGNFGRRTMYLSGQGTMTVVLFIIGLLGLISPNNSGAQWAIGGLLLVYTFVYDATVGPVCYSLVSELPSTRLRQKTVVLARNAYNIIGIVTNILTPRMLNPTAWNWRAKTGFFWAGSCLICLAWTYFRLPEPKGRTYAELDLLFEQKVPARKFKTTVVDPFASRAQSEEKVGKTDYRGPKHKPDALGIRAVIEYLEEEHDKEKKLTYESPNERQLLNQWPHFQMSGQGPYYGRCGWFSVLHPENIPSVIDHYKTEIQRILGVLKTALEGKDCLVGDKCTFADLSFLPWNCRLDALLQTPLEVDPLDAFPNVQKRHQRMVSHDAWKRAMEIRDKLMDEQGLQSNGMPKGITNIKEYEKLIAKHAAAAAAEAA